MSLDKNKTVAEVGRRTRLRNHDVQKMLEALVEVWLEELAQSWALSISSSIAKGIHQAAHEGFGKWNKCRLGRNDGKFNIHPQVVTNPGDSIGKSGLRFAIPSRRAQGERMSKREMMGQQRDKGKQSQDGWTGAQDGVGGPLALTFKAQMSADFLEGHFNAPTSNNPGQNLQGVGGLVGSEEGGRQEFVKWVTDEYPADRQWVEPRAIPQGAACRQLNDPLASAIPGNFMRFP